MARKFLSIKNFEKYQHYRDRNPPWVKLYWDLLSDDKFVMLNLAERGLYCLLILLASRHYNRIPVDLLYIQLQLKLPTKPDLTRLIADGFLLARCYQRVRGDASKMLTRCRAPSTEREFREQSSEKEKEKKISSANGLTSLESFKVSTDLETWSVKEGIPHPELYLEEFKDHWRSCGGKRKGGQPVKNWPATYRNWLRFLKEHGKLKPASWREQFLQEGQA